MSHFKNIYSKTLLFNIIVNILWKIISSETQIFFVNMYRRNSYEIVFKINVGTIELNTVYNYIIYVVYIMFGQNYLVNTVCSWLLRSYLVNDTYFLKIKYKLDSVSYF